MNRKIVISALLLAFIGVTAFAADVDNSPSAKPSYFEGTWNGSWEILLRSNPQNVSIKIERGKRPGVFIVTYSWESTRMPASDILPGSFKTIGREESDKFHFQWKDKQGRVTSVTLTKDTDNEAKGRIDRPEPLPSGVRPYSESKFKRK